MCTKRHSVLCSHWVSLTVCDKLLRDKQSSTGRALSPTQQAAARAQHAAPQTPQATAAPQPCAVPCHLAASRCSLSLCHEGRVVLTALGLALAECLGR